MKKMIAAVMTVAMLMTGCSGFSYDRTDGSVSPLSRNAGGTELGSFTSIEANVAYTNVVLQPGYGFRVDWEYTSDDDEVFNVDVVDGVLHITENSTVKAYSFYSDGNNDLVIKVPMGTIFDEVQVQTSGDISLSDFTIGTATLQGSYNNVRLKDLAITGLTLEMGNSNISSENLTVETCTLKNSYGSFSAAGFTSHGLDVDIQNCEIEMSGDLTGHTEINGSYSNVTLNTTQARSNYKYNLDCNHGEITVDGTKSGESNTYENEGAQNEIRMDISTGSIKLNFA